MGEHKGALKVFILFIAFIAPGLFMFGLDSLHQHAFMKVTAEVGELVKEEGGVTEKVANTVNELQKRGYTISFKDSNGRSISQTVDFGETIVSNYTYKYTNVFIDRTLTTKNTIEILKRNSQGSGNILDGGVIKTITLQSDETTNQNDFFQTFKVPGLKGIRRLVSETGSAQVVNAVGENVTIRMKNGSPTRHTQIHEGEAEDTKFVDDYDGPFYDKDGYSGTLEKYVVSGEYVEGETKEIKEHDSPDYNVDGYVGKLEKYLASGNYLPEDSKEVAQSLTLENYSTAKSKRVFETITSDENMFPNTMEYNKGGFKGTLSKSGHVMRQVVKGEYSPAQSKNVIESITSKEKKFPETLSYSKENFDGTLYKYGSPTSTVVSGGYIPAEQKYIRNHDSPYYQQDNYTGTLEKYLVSGTPADSRVQQITAKTEHPTWHKRVNIQPSYPYNQEGYTGTLTKKSEVWKTVPQSVVLDIQYTYYSTDANAIEFTQVDYEKTRQDIANTFGPNNADGNYFVNPTIASFAWKGPVQSGSFNDKGTAYSYKREANVVIRVDGHLYEAIFEGVVTRPDTQLFKYRGYVTKPAVDTRIFEFRQTYAGTVTKPEKDTRVYQYKQEYTGEVREEGLDTIPKTLDYSSGGYVGTLMKDGDVIEKLRSGKYIPADEKYVEGLETQNYNKDGYTGTLEKYVESGEYIREDTKTISWKRPYYGYNVSQLSPLKVINYDPQMGASNGLKDSTMYTGILQATGQPYVTAKAIQTLSTADSAFRLNSTSESEIAYLTDEQLTTRYSKNLINDLVIGSLEKQGYQNVEIVSLQFTSSTFFDKKSGEYARHFKAIFNADYYTFIQEYVGVVTKDAQDTRVYKYRGIVKRPEIDTRVYEFVQNYKGTVTHPETDTRVYKYRGIVEKPTVDTRVYKYRGTVTKPASTNTRQTNYYQYNMTLEYEAWQ